MSAAYKSNYHTNGSAQELSQQASVSTIICIIVVLRSRSWSFSVYVHVRTGHQARA